jgi:hypothetical protein
MAGALKVAKHRRGDTTPASFIAKESISPWRVWDHLYWLDIRGRKGNKKPEVD